MSNAEINVAYALVLKYFGGNHNKAFTWWLSPNPQFGQVSPRELEMSGRGTWLLRWIKQQIADNEANETARRRHEKAVES